MQITKYVLPVVVGAMSGMILIKIGENGIYKLYPLPPGTDLYDAESTANAVKQMPLSAFLFFLANYTVCSFIAGIIATLVSQRTTIIPPVVVGIVMTVAGLLNVILVRHPMWFSVLNLFIYLPLSYFG